MILKNQSQFTNPVQLGCVLFGSCTGTEMAADDSHIHEQNASEKPNSMDISESFKTG